MKKSGIITLIAVVILIAVVAATLVSGTFARYATTDTATATVATAAWSFEGAFADPANAGQTVTTINLSDTLTQTYPNLATGHIAPGTSGSFKILVDGAGSEVGIDYTVDLAMANDDELPSGLVFTVDGNEMETTNNTASLTGSIPLANVGTAVEKTVTWVWTYGNDAAHDNYDEDATDGVNNNDAGLDLTLNVTIKGEQHITAIN